jgi:transforming growth factor-beta-induced protein
VPGRILAADLTEGATVTTVEGGTLTIRLGGGARVNGAAIIATDIEASNGVVHLIDAVLTDHLDLVDVAVLNGFDALVAAVAAAGLVDALRSDNGGAGFTVFAPTDAAFAALGTAPSDPDALAQVLLYHVVPGTALSGSLSDGQTLATLQGGTLTVALGGGVTVQGDSNAAGVVAADVRAANGVVHAIDTVLIP